MQVLEQLNRCGYCKQPLLDLKQEFHSSCLQAVEQFNLSECFSCGQKLSDQTGYFECAITHNKFCSEKCFSTSHRYNKWHRKIWKVINHV